jgi:hypothetical protein
MKRVALMLAAAGLVTGLMSGCNSDGIEFNGVKQVEQFPIRKTPIVHYNLPSEVIDPLTGEASVDAAILDTVNLRFTDFAEKSTPGHDLWLMSMYAGLPGAPGWASLTDPPAPPPAPTDWEVVLNTEVGGGAAWPDPTVTLLLATTPAHEFIAAWTLSFQNQWFLREVNGSDVVPVVLGAAPVIYEGLFFKSMPISIIEGSQGTVTISTAPSPGQHEAIPVGPPATGANGVQQIVIPASNVCDYAYGDTAAIAGMRGAGWQEPPAKNLHIEDNLASLIDVPAPPYFGAGGPVTTLGGVYHHRFGLDWVQTTSGAASTIDSDDGVQYAYYLAAVGNHIIGYGLGLIDSSFALPGILKNQEDIMNQSVILDMTAFIAAGKEFQFVLEDLVRMQDVINGDFTTPGPKSTLPGKYR